MAPPPLLGLGLALAAAAGNNIGKGLQKAATRQLPQLNLGRSEVVRAYLGSPSWLLGLALDVGGGGAMLGALAAAPVSLVQPVAAFGLVLLAAFSHFVLQERLGPSQWRGAALATAGIVGMGVSSSSSSSSSEAHTAAAAAAAAAAVEPPTAAAAAAAAGFALSVSLGRLCAPLGVACSLGLSSAGVPLLLAYKNTAAAAADAGFALSVTLGRLAAPLGVACSLGLSSFALSVSLGRLAAPLGVACSLGLSSAGFVLQTRGFKHGSALVVCTTAAAASIVAGVLVGLLALSEPLPASRHAKLLLLGSWAAVFWGVSSMAGSEVGGARRS
ncbi:hypothetical protein OEZ85_013727 [Tetradesmus obliquus]|uniref:Probable magnesium transporter n=1 Tax=Tetradesmus obliquus TaxID=3088 RepID=A0ABY8USB6_TETOB|nr:hypothetical protein OEZ85_013727 [Tetradesmus obliquus]